MKTIKLLNLTSLVYFAVLGLLMLVCYSVFFIIIQKTVFGSTNEALANRKQRILKEIRRNGNRIPKDAFPFTDFRLSVYHGLHSRPDIYADTAVYEKRDGESYDFRKLSTVQKIGAAYYQMDIVVPSMERESIISSISKTITLVLILVIFTFLLATLFFSKLLWKPFYSTLVAIDGYRIEKNDALQLGRSRITEFEKLNTVLTNLTWRAAKAFEDQKQFIENASHELQTPLAIHQHKLEQLIDDPAMTSSQAQIVQALIHSTHRMTKLNRTLLLLAKIENGQFPDTEKVTLDPLIAEILSRFEDQRIAQHITLSQTIDPAFWVEGNRMLLDLLISNLIKNALVHNVPNGRMEVAAGRGILSVSNTSNGSEIPSDMLYERFYKHSTREESWGLGLAIAKRITTLNGWEIIYGMKMNTHSFTIVFNQEQ